MSLQVCHGATLHCSMGLMPACLRVLPGRGPTRGGRPIAQVSDHRPLVNIEAFGTCTARGRPRRCVPVTVAPWSPGAPGIALGAEHVAAISRTSTLSCSEGGLIRVIDDASPDARWS
jgi:hypothetical protein